MQQIYKFYLEEAKDIIRKEMKLPEDAIIEIEGLPRYTTYPYGGGMCGNVTTVPLQTAPLIYCNV